ncbi:hypothetical protein [Azonexus sp.]|uniref:T6SS immunity protein Tli3 family protein n=1 Tax=Azonexus sp. TaxID=1872668 RepID=UPI0035B170D4
MEQPEQGYGAGMSKLLLGGFVTLISGCASVASISTGTGAMPVHQRPTYNSPQQVIYRIDDHRYITLENYRDCRVGGIMKWHDQRKNLEVEMGRYKNEGKGFWPGRFSIEPGEMKFAIPNFWCGEKWCYLSIVFTNDGGKTWDAFRGMTYSSNSFEDKKERKKVVDTDVRVTKDGYVYIVPMHLDYYIRRRFDGFENGKPWGFGSGERCELIRPPNMSTSEHLALTKACEESRRKKPPFPPLEPDRYDEYNFSSIPLVKTPSGQERFACDPSLNPVVEEE